MTKMLGHCMNWKVLAGLAAVGVGVAVVAPSALAAALPLLLIAVCPISMLVMMLMMRGGMPSESATTPAIAPTAGAMTHEERLVKLQAELAGTQARQAAIAQELAELRTPAPVRAVPVETSP